MTNIGHFRAAGKMLDQMDGNLPTKLWVCPPTEMPGCSLCMGNQARVADKCTVVSTSTRNFPNRLGRGANVYLASAELAAIAAVLGKLPTREEYMNLHSEIQKTASNTYRYLNFDQTTNYVDAAEKVDIDQDMLEQ